jgi:hypothetical protein
MSSIVLELQREAMDTAVPVSAVVRKAYVIASKLHVPELAQWCERELNGYMGLPSKEIPPYRRIVGEVKYHNPYRGWCPVVFENPEMARALSTQVIAQSINEIEHLVSDRETKGQVLSIPFDPKVLNEVFRDSEEFGLGFIPQVIVSASQIHGVLERVRDSVLQFSLDLEKRGILGEGLTFTREEREKASTITTYNIGTFTGILGNVTSRAVDIGDSSALLAELKRLRLPPKEQREIEEILGGLPGAEKEKKQTLVTRGMEWVARNSETIGGLARMLKSLFDTMSGGSSGQA